MKFSNLTRLVLGIAAWGYLASITGYGFFDIEWISQQFKDVSKLGFLAISTTGNGLMWITYIVFLTEMQKRQTLRNGFALIGKRYHK